MNAPNNDEPDIGWLSDTLLAFGVGCLLVMGWAIVSGSVLAGLLAISVAVVFFALRRIIDQQDAVSRRLHQIEVELQSRRGGSA